MSNDRPSGECSNGGKIRRCEIAVFVGLLMAIAVLGFVVADQLQRARVNNIADVTDGALLGVIQSVNRDFSQVMGVTRSLAMLFFSGLNSSVIPNPSLPAAQQQFSLIEAKFAAFAARESRRLLSIYSFQSRPGNIITQILPTGTAQYGLNLNEISPKDIAAAKVAPDGFIAGPIVQQHGGFPGLVTSWPLWLRTFDAESPHAIPSEYFGTVGIVVNLTRFVERLDLIASMSKATSRYDGMFVDKFEIAYHIKNTATDNETWFGSPEIAALSTVRSASTTVSGVQSTVYIVAEESASSPTEIGAAVGVSVGAFLLLLIAIFMYINWRSMKENERDLSNAPTGVDGKPFVIIFTDIEKSTLLWSTVPLSMQAALDTSFGIITRLVENRNLYIVKTIGDSIMLAVNDPNVAAALMADIQREHQRATWPACIDRVYDPHSSEDELLDIVDDPNDLSCAASSDNGMVFRGIRIRIGAAYGTPKAVFDNVTKSIDYFGATTNLASRIEAAARGGQILVSRELSDAIDAALVECSLTPAGDFALKGIIQSVPLFELCPRELIARMLANETTAVVAPEIVLHGIERTAGGSEASGADDPDGFSESVYTRFSAEEERDREREREDMVFFRALLKTSKAQDKALILELLSNNWRCNGAVGEDDRMAKIVQRVTRVKTTMMEKEARRANRSRPDDTPPPDKIRLKRRGSSTGGWNVYSQVELKSVSAGSCNGVDDYVLGANSKGTPNTGCLTAAASDEPRSFNASGSLRNVAAPDLLDTQPRSWSSSEWAGARASDSPHRAAVIAAADQELADITLSDSQLLVAGPRLIPVMHVADDQ